MRQTCFRILVRVDIAEGVVEVELSKLLRLKELLSTAKGLNCLCSDHLTPLACSCGDDTLIITYPKIVQYGTLGVSSIPSSPFLLVEITSSNSIKALKVADTVVKHLREWGSKVSLESS